MQMLATALLAGLFCSVVPVPDGNVPLNQFTVVSWNVDSGDADPHVISLRVAQMRGVDLWGLTEVRDERWAELLKGAAQENHPGRMVPLLSPTGGSSRSLILYDAAQFELLESFELGWEGQSWCRPDMVLRPGLIARLRHTPTEQEFFFMVNRFLPAWAVMQAAKVNDWAAHQTIPVIAVGSYYFQYALSPQAIWCEGRKGLKLMAYDGAFQWIKPENPIKTFDHEANTIEDFVFVANAVGKLHAQSTILVEPGDFPDGPSTSDHRPICTAFTVLAAPETMIRYRIRQQISRIQSEIDALEALVHQLPD